MYYSSFCNNLKRLILFSIFFLLILFIFINFFVGSQNLLKKNANKHEKSIKRIVVPVQTPSAHLFANFIYDI